MRLPELHDALIITERKINDISTIKLKIESQLHALKARTDITDNVITFKTITTIMPWGYVESYPVLFRIYKDGSIVIEKHKKSLQIKWTVKLDNLLFIASFSSVILGIIAYFMLNTELVYTLISSFILCIGFFFIVVLLGIQIIKYKMSDLIESSVYRSY